MAVNAGLLTHILSPYVESRPSRRVNAWLLQKQLPPSLGQGPSQTKVMVLRSECVEGHTDEGWCPDSTEAAVGSRELIAQGG